jgi:hypothetical protein
MQKTLICNISLSKKLRSLLKSGGSILLTADSIENGKGTALLNISDNRHQDLNVQDLLDKETSIMVTPTGVQEDASSLNASVTNIFSNNDAGQQGRRTSIDRLAATQPPALGDVPHALVQVDEIQTPDVFDALNDHDCRNFISDMQELVDEVNASKNKRSDIDLNQYSNARLQAVAMEQMEKDESIGMDAYVVNDSCASLTINDIDLMLPLDMPKNIGHISARRLSASNELWGLLRQGLIKIISPEKAQFLIKNAGNIQRTVVPELEVYSSSGEAEHAMAEAGGPRDAAPVLDLSLNDLEGESEEMSNLRASQSSAVAQGSARTLSGGTTRRSFHGAAGEVAEDSLDRFAGMEKVDRRVTNKALVNSKGIKTISRAKQ